MASTTKSVLLTTKSAHCTMPSPFLSTTSKRPAGCQSVTHRGSSAILRADQLGVDREPREGGVGRRGEVQQEDEEQRPRHRGARLAHRGRGVVAGQDVRQPRRADHEAERQGEEVPHADAGRHREIAAELGVVAGRRRGRLPAGQRGLRLQLLDLGLGEAARLDLGVDLVGVLLPERARLLLLGVARDLDGAGVVLLEDAGRRSARGSGCEKSCHDRYTTGTR